jgi:hypothetical protein
MEALDDKALLGEVLGAREIGIEGGKAGPGRGHKTKSNGLRLRSGMMACRALLDRPALRVLLAASVRSAPLARPVQAGLRRC